ncbi:copper amine oxidase N-terminal domain-containing protein [Paenibacillus sp. R14(2021)]|uniref:copper amine oxidase N-terminal domain-containing protein n=1 Tax=Paenibacillus sp. R14(2021) TaxID=2859228 RepID=UPI001C613EC6|nr:copper amine oxidase N-terminal domain-containing protein [Paenibacillus sp. R14(2021)]
MKKNNRIAAVVAVTMLAGSLMGGGAALAETPKLTTSLPIKLLYNARQLLSEVQPEKVNGTTLVPLRVVSDKLGGTLMLTGKDIRIVKGKSTLALTIGVSTASINGKTTKLPVSVKVVNGRTLVPLRVVSEGLGVSVEWDAVNQFVWIGNKDVPKLEDAIKPVDIKPYAHFYAKDPYFLKDLLNEGKPFTKARIITQQDFPLIISGDIYYRMDLARDPKGKTYTRASTTDKGVMGRTFLFLQTGERVKFRSETPYYRESIGTDIRIHYNPVVSKDDFSRLKIKTYESLSIKSIEYIDIRADSDSKILFENLWR